MFHASGDSTTKQGARSYLMRLGFIWGIWTLVGIFFASQVYFLLVNTQRPVTFSMALVWQLSCVYVSALATPLVLRLARRYRIERHNWRRNLLLHALLSILISIPWAAALVTLDALFYAGVSRLTAYNLAARTFGHLDKELLVYWIIVLISHALNYYQRYREGELRASQAQLQALKMQLHPHFLFNVLHSISSLVYTDPAAADKMIARLGDFLRITLENSVSQEVLLRQELEFLQCYLEIERTRFHDRLTTNIDVEAQALNCRVPNLILQPIVENAIRHGIAPRSVPGRIEIRAARKNGMLRLQVADNGSGLPQPLATNQLSGEGIGLANTRARLNQLYGSAHRFEIENAPQGGTVVTLEIPLLSSAEQSSGAEQGKTNALLQPGLSGGSFWPLPSK